MGFKGPFNPTIPRFHGRAQKWIFLSKSWFEMSPIKAAPTGAFPHL